MVGKIEGFEIDELDNWDLDCWAQEAHRLRAELEEANSRAARTFVEQIKIVEQFDDLRAELVVAEAQVDEADSLIKQHYDRAIAAERQWDALAEVVRELLELLSDWWEDMTGRDSDEFDKLDQVRKARIALAAIPDDVKATRKEVDG